MGGGRHLVSPIMNCYRYILHEWRSLGCVGSKNEPKSIPYNGIKNTPYIVLIQCLLLPAVKEKKHETCM